MDVDVQLVHELVFVDAYNRNSNNPSWTSMRIAHAAGGELHSVAHATVCASYLRINNLEAGACDQPAIKDVHLYMHHIAKSTREAANAADSLSLHDDVVLLRDQCHFLKVAQRIDVHALHLAYILARTLWDQLELPPVLGGAIPIDCKPTYFLKNGLLLPQRA